jgi:uncharacterized tellurite resistance protein B-like protein
MTFREILELFRQGKATAKSHIKNLIEIATADGRYADEENDLLIRIAARNGISKSRLEEIRAKANSIDFEVPKDEREKFRQMYELVHMMIVDRNIHPEEARLCELFAARFGYRKDGIKGMIETIRNNIDNGNDVQETHERVQYYLKFHEMK